MFLQDLKWYDFESALMGCLKVDIRAASLISGLQEATGAQAPRVAWLQTGEAEFRAWRTEVVADVFRIGQKFGGHHGADGMAALICIAGVAQPVAKETSQRVGAAGDQRAAKNIDAVVRCHDP